MTLSHITHGSLYPEQAPVIYINVYVGLSMMPEQRKKIGIVLHILYPISDGQDYINNWFIFIKVVKS